MSKLLHTKAERTKLLKTFPSNNDGKDGDIVLCSISGRGIYICAKIDGRWFTANKMQDLKKVEKTSINDLKTKKLSIKQLQDAGSDTDKFVVADAEGNLKYRTGSELISDIAMSLNDLSDVTYSSGDLTITSLDKIISGDLEIDSSGDITLDAYGKQINFATNGTTMAVVDLNASSFKLMHSSDQADYFLIQVSASGATIIGTTDDGAAVGHLAFRPDGDLILDPVSQKTIINASDKLFFDGGTDTYIYEHSADYIRFVVGGVSILGLTEAGGGTSDKVAIPMQTGLYFDGGTDTYIYEAAADELRIIVGDDIMMVLDENGADGNNVFFRDASVGFTRVEATFSATGIIGSGGTDDTDIDFRFTNKYRLEMTGDITTINLIFPAASGNFLLVCATNGDHDVSYWKAFEYDESAATTADVLWAGGSVPAFTNSGVDIVSFYWDADEQQAYGVASLAFATP